MKKFKIKIDSQALNDIQEIKQWYNLQKPSLGIRFRNTTIKQINTLDKVPFSYAIRYKEIRCMLIRSFPYMVHFYINHRANTVEVLAVISTDRNPMIWKEKTGDSTY